MPRFSSRNFEQREIGLIHGISPVHMPTYIYILYIYTPYYIYIYIYIYMGLTYIYMPIHVPICTYDVGEAMLEGDLVYEALSY
jgi:hypothetical protein